MVQNAAGLLTTCVTIFLGIFIEAAPFLLIGTIASGLVEVFVDRDDLLSVIPKNVFLATITGAMLGLVFPVCECGVVPLTRRLLSKGLPLSSGVAFLLAAPIINPIVVASTYAAYGLGTVLAARLIMGVVVAVAVGMIFTLKHDPHELIRVGIPEHSHDEHDHQAMGRSIRDRLRASFQIAGEEFFEMGKYLVLGGLIASVLQIGVPQPLLRTVGSNPVLSVLALLALAYILSVCSTVDALLSLTFVNSFSTGSIIAFLVFGPMVDVKSTLMFAQVFKTKAVVYLIALPFLMAALLSLVINLHTSW